MPSLTEYSSTISLWNQKFKATFSKVEMGVKPSNHFSVRNPFLCPFLKIPLQDLGSHWQLPRPENILDQNYESFLNSNTSAWRFSLKVENHLSIQGVKGEVSKARLDFGAWSTWGQWNEMILEVSSIPLCSWILWMPEPAAWSGHECKEQRFKMNQTHRVCSQWHTKGDCCNWIHPNFCNPGSDLS